MCSHEKRRARLRQRTLKGTSDSDGRAEIMDVQEAAFEPLEEAHIVIDTSGPKEATLAKGLRAIYIG